jgi:hypothetical protein
VEGESGIPLDPSIKGSGAGLDVKPLLPLGVQAQVSFDHDQHQLQQ